MYDLDMNLLWVSPSIKKQTGYTPEELKRIFPLETMTPESIEKVMEAFDRGKQLYEQGKEFIDHFDLEAEVYRKDGSTFWADVRYRLIRDSQGQPSHVLMQGRDITEHRKADEVLRESEERFRDLAELLPQTVFEADDEGRFTFINRQGQRNLGYSDEDVARGINVLQTVSPEDHARAAELIGRLRAGEKLGPSEHISIRKDGSRFPVVVYGTAILEDGRYAGMRGIVVDITDRKQTEEALRLSEERYRLIAENTSDCIWMMGPDLRITYQSPSTERVFGYTAGEWEAVGFRGWVHPDYIGTVVSTLKSFRAGDIRDNVTITIQARHKAGHFVWVEISASAIRDPEGRLEGIVGVSRDVTERKEAEDRLLEYRTAVEQSADGIAIANLDGNISFVNEAWATMHGYAVEELIGRHLSIFHTREQMESQVIPFNRSLQEKGSKEGEVWHVRRNGEQFPSWMTTTILKRADGEPFGMFALMRDITGQKEMERQQREREIAEARAEELSRSRRRLIEAQESLRKDIASQLHGTVQNRLILLGHRLAELESRPASERTTEELASIRHTLEELQRDQIRPISHRLYPSILRLGIAAGLESLVDLYSSELPIDLRVSRNLREGEQANRKLVPDNVKLALYRVAEEVLANIVKHAPMVNSVAVKLALSDAGILRLTVSDDGPGFDTAAPRKGIGLAIISDYAAAAGASCEVKSVPGRGTRVTARVQLEGIGARPRRKGRTSG
ncbi:MAG: PAS domain S-box protein [Dehalococcoidia bacterium]